MAEFTQPQSEELLRRILCINTFSQSMSMAVRRFDVLMGEGIAGVGGGAVIWLMLVQS